MNTLWKLRIISRINFISFNSDSEQKDYNTNVRAEKKLVACGVGRKSLKQAPCHTHSPLIYNEDKLLGQQEKGLKWTSHMSAKQTTTRQTPKRNIETESQEKRINIFFNLERTFQTGNGTMKYIFLCRDDFWACFWSVQMYLIDHNCSSENNSFWKLGSYIDIILYGKQIWLKLEL